MDNIKFPYFNMQQLNLDWMLEKMAEMPVIVSVPVLAGDDLSDVVNMIDYKAQDIPRGICFMLAGTQDDPNDRRCACLLFKMDDDNIVGLAMSVSGNIGVWAITKVGGVWQ